MSTVEPPEPGPSEAESDHQELVLPSPPPPTGQIVRRSARLARAHVSDGLLAGLLILAPTSLLSAFLNRELLSFEFYFGGGGPSGGRGASWVGFLEAVLLSPWAFATVFLLLAGRVSSFAAAVPAALRRLPHVLVATVLASLLCVLPVLPAIIAFLSGGGAAFMEDLAADGEIVLLGGLPDGLLAAMALVLLAIPVVVFLGLSLGLTLPLVVADGMGPVQALKTSWARMSGQRLRLLGGTLGLFVPATAVLMFAVFVLTFPALAIGPEGGWVILAAANAVFGVTVTILLSAVYAVVHADTAPVEAAADAEGPPRPR